MSESKQARVVLTAREKTEIVEYYKQHKDLSHGKMPIISIQNRRILLGLQLATLYTVSSLQVPFYRPQKRKNSKIATLNRKIFF